MDPDHPARRVVAEARARNPRELAHQLAILYDGSRAQAGALQSRDVITHARRAAKILIDLATTRARGSGNRP